MELTSPKVIKELLEEFGFTFSKSLGQNFLINSAIPVKIAESSGIDAESEVLEVGPGIGCLTKELAKRAGHVTAVEIDRRLIPMLDRTLAEFDNVDVINDDILNVDLAALAGKTGKPLTVCANLPYYITTPIIMALLESNAPIRSITVMVQKELAQRFCAGPGGKDYGTVTASAAYYADVKTLFGVSAGSFMPAPKVDSAVIRFDIKPENKRVSVRDKDEFFRVIRAAFSMRRKTLQNNLRSAYPFSSEQTAAVISSAGLSPSARGETLSTEDFARLADAVSNMKKEMFI